MDGNVSANEHDNDIELEVNDDLTDAEGFVEDFDSVGENEDEESSENEDEEATENENGEASETKVFPSRNGHERNSLSPSFPKCQIKSIVTENSGLINGSVDVNTMREMFALFITTDMVKEICEKTCQTDCLVENKIKSLSEDELYAFFGIMLASGRNQSWKLSLRELWTSDGLFSQPFFTAAMSQNRFTNIYNHIRFDDREIKQEQCDASSNELEPIKSILDKFVDACQKNYSPTNNISVDEYLAIFFENCHLYYNQSKGVADTRDKTMAEYSCVRSTRRWPFRIFMDIIDMAALNAYSLWIFKYPEWKKNSNTRRQKYFIRELSLDLAKSNIIKRKTYALKLHKLQLAAIDLAMSHCVKMLPEIDIIASNSEEGVSTSAASRAKARACRFCPFKTKRRSTLACNICKKPVCTTHRKTMISCSNCEKMNAN